VIWVKWKLVLVHLDIVLISTQDRCSDWDEHTMARNSFWVYPMELFGNMGQMEARFSPFGDYVNLDSRLVHDLCQTYHALRNQFGHT
jgi:hypothetical protein